MRIAFMGTPHFSVPLLKSLLDSSHEVVAVYTQPPRPSGRGYHVRKSEVQMLAEEHGIEVHTPYNFKDLLDIKVFQELNLDLAIVVAYGLIVPQSILDAPKYGCVNIHASLLPRWRGAAPIQRAIEAGDPKTGVALMRMEAGLDTGPVYAVSETEIAHKNSAELHDELSLMGADLLRKTIDRLPTMTPTPQDIEGVTYAKKIQKEEGIIDWQDSAEALDRKMRAFTPWPGLSFLYQSEAIRMPQAEFETRAHDFAPGTVIDEHMTIACKEGVVKPLILQRPGKKALPVDEFLRGNPVPQGTVLCGAIN